MKYAFPFLVLMAFALPLPAAAQKADMSCVKGDCKKTDPAKEAEKEMHKAAGVDIPIEAPVQGAAEPVKTPPVPMGADDAIQEIQAAVAKEDASRPPSLPDAPIRTSPPGTPSCHPFAQNQRDVGAKIDSAVAAHTAEQKRISDKVADAVRGHKEEQIRISREITASADANQKRQAVIAAEHAEYQRKLKEDGLVVRDKLAANVAEHRGRYTQLRCLPYEAFKNFSIDR